jgi:hypothetical protein
VIKIIEDKHKSDSGGCLIEIWERVATRTCSSTIISRIKAQGEIFTTASLGFLLGNQTESIVSYYRQL